jgi:phosphatidylinositol dimannoside acyltransferase
VKFRDVFTWKFLFYDVLLPLLRLLGPERADAVLGRLGRLSVPLWPPRRKKFVQALTRASDVLDGRWNADILAPELASGVLRFLARDYLLDTRDNARALALFDVEGADVLRHALASGRGVVLVGSHLGGHIAAFHWLYRSGLAVRLMVQRPRHVSSSLNALFDRDDPGATPQSEFFLHRGLGRAECVMRFLSARSALRAGKALYLAGDVPWSGKNTRAGRFLGQTRRVLSVWADLAVLTRSPVFFVFCTHGEKGRHTLSFEPVGELAPGGEDAAVSRYFARLEAAIAAHPTDAAAHLLWPCYGPPTAAARPLTARPSRRVAAVRL